MGADRRRGTPVPGVMEVVRRRGVARSVRDIVERFVAADGTSHTRALAYQSMFVVLSGFIGFVGIASVFDLSQVRSTVEQLATTLSPGPSSRLLVEAAHQGARDGTAALIAGLGSALIAGTLAMAQIERSANRILGSRHDRRALRRFGVALLLALSAGVLMAASALILGGGHAIATGAGWESGAATAWSIGRWPLGVLVAFGAVWLLFRTAPRRPPRTRGSVPVGAFVAVALWVAFTGLLSLYFSVSNQSSQTYGPLLAIIALLLWCVLSSLALHLGLAVAAELDATRSQDRMISVPDSAAVATAPQASS
jgi:YihY family inner membrane protein